MAISFRPPAPPPPPADEQSYWRVTKRDPKSNVRIAEARVRRVPDVGLELRILVGGELAFSQLSHPLSDLRLLGHLSECCREAFERLGWTRVEPPRTPEAQQDAAARDTAVDDR